MYLAKLNDPKWIPYLVYTVDIFSRLNVLNKSLEGPGAGVTDTVDKLKSFQMNLELWETKVKKGNFDVLETLVDRQDISDQMVTLILDHLSSLQNEIKRYFPDVSEGILKLISDPFHIDVGSVNLLML
ncbi:zinc finger BED domain-containing protein 5-like [Palaemon carinicauda]|uniref:zinc finger BED domain-containing protein 5-like n=1 Tax=Palaemon carinicauda TaxID=392227 RepID=UPI0035B66C47